MATTTINDFTAMVRTAGSRRRSLAIATATAATVISPLINAAEWRFTPTVSVTETYTDNVFLATKGQEKSDLVTQIAPGFSITSNSPRLKLSANYALEGTSYLHSSGGSGFNNQLSATLNAEVIRKLFFIDAKGNVGQQNISAFGTQSTNNVNINSNRTDVRTYSISPYLLYSFGNKAAAELRYTHDSVGTGSALLGMSNNDRLSFSLNSGETSTKFAWGLQAVNQRNHTGNQPTVEQESYSANIRYFLTPNFSTTALAGYEKETYVAIGDRTPGGPFYSVGLIWKPTSRTEVTATAGHRFFGPTYSLLANHRARNSVFRLSYTEDVTSAQQQFAGQSAISTVSFLDQLYAAQFPDPVTRQQIVNAVIQQTGLPVNLANPVNSFTNAYFVQKNLQGSVALSGVRNNVVLSVFAARRIADSVQSPLNAAANSPFVGLNDSNKQLGASATWNTRLSSDMNVLADLNFTRTTSLATARVDTYKTARLALSKTFQEKLSGSIGLRHSQQSSAVLGGDVRENAITASVVAKF